MAAAHRTPSGAGVHRLPEALHRRFREGADPLEVLGAAREAFLRLVDVLSGAQDGGTPVRRPQRRLPWSSADRGDGFKRREHSSGELPTPSHLDASCARSQHPATEGADRGLVDHRTTLDPRLQPCARLPQEVSRQRRQTQRHTAASRGVQGHTRHHRPRRAPYEPLTDVRHGPPRRAAAPIGAATM